MTELRRCAGTNERGEPCGKPAVLVGDDGFCITHRPGGMEHMKAASAAAAQVRSEKAAAEGLRPGELPLMNDTTGVIDFLNVVARALGERRITDREAQAFRGLAGESTKAISAAIAERLESETHRELEEKDAEIAELRRQIAELRGTGNTLRAVK